MVIVVNSSADLPSCLNTTAKQVKKAKQLAHAHTGILPRRVQGPPMQGFFSRTMIVTFPNGDELVIQFRPEPLDLEPFRIARTALGSVVPDIGKLEDEELERDGMWAYWMSRIPGTTWLDGVRGRYEKTLVTVNRSLGRVLSKGLVEGKSEEVIQQRLRPHLQLLLESQEDSIRPFHGVAKELLGKLDQLKSLPLFISHFDLNAVNIMINQDCEVSGLIDWELSTLLPFGVGFGRIHTMAGEFSDQKFRMPDEFEEAERGFWQEICDGISTDTYKLVTANANAVQTAVTLGTLLETFELNEGKVSSGNPVSVEALPKLLTYRIPLVRGTDPPYQV